MERLKLFLTNFLVYGFGSIISKMIPLLMLPVITRILPDTTYFGLNDIFTVIVSFATSVSIMGMYDAMFRMFFEKDDTKYQKEICSSAMAVVTGNALIIFVVLLLFRNTFAQLIFGSTEYVVLVDLLAMSSLVSATNGIISAPTRIKNEKKIFVVTNTVSSILGYAISIPMLLRGHYLIALPLASIISAACIEIFFAIRNKGWFSVKSVRKEQIKAMLPIALPLLPNFIVYWVFNSADKLMIAKMLGNNFAGIYAAGSKMGHISNLIYSAFAGGWQYFAFSTMKDDDQVKLTSNIFEYLAVISYLATMAVCLGNKIIFKIFFTEDYTGGMVVMPYLFLSPLLLMLYQVIANQFLVIKKTVSNVLILSLGAILNLVLNYILIPAIGIEGAAIATLVGYICSVLLCVIVLEKKKLLDVSARFWINTVVFGIFFFVWKIFGETQSYICWGMAIVVAVSYLLSYKKELGQLRRGK